ncbi:MAG TPA: hypothetical protein P5060_02535 [Candidatus Absconditabacterales bacterium]|nr:hypothetical protein [Candidatus Absconditabacterales bacterium]
MKKKNIIIIGILVLVIVVVYFIYNKKMPLNDIYIGSTFPPEDQKVFEEQLSNFDLRELTGYTDVIDKARLYDYLGYPGKAILVYKDFISTDTGEYVAVLTNIGHLYKEVCEVNGKLNRSYCKEAINGYEYIISKYGNKNLYKGITEVYLKMGNDKKAKKYYKLYQDTTGRSESWIEKKLEL